MSFPDRTSKGAMRSRRQLAILCVLIAVAFGLAVFALQLEAPRTVGNIATKIGEPVQNRESKTPPVRGQEIVDTEKLPPLANPPPKPLKRNDPTTGLIWFRVLDGETNRPIASTPCRLTSFSDNGDYIFYGDAWLTGHDRETDRDGLVCATFRDCRTSPLPKTQWKDGKPLPSPKLECDYMVNDHGELERWAKYPMPARYEPDTDPRLVETLVIKFANGEYAEIIDVLVRRTRDISGIVVDSQHKPVPGAAVFAVADKGDGNDDWLACISYFYERRPRNRPDNEKSIGYRVAEIIEEQFENTRPRLIRPIGINVELPDELNRPDRLRYAAYSKWARYWCSNCTQDGVFQLEDLPRGIWIVGAYDPLLGFTTATVDLRAGNPEVRLTLPDDATARLDVSVEWLGDAVSIPQPTDRRIFPFVIHCCPASSYGIPQQHLSSRFEFAPDGAHPWRFSLVGLREGFWSVQVAYSESCAMQSVRLTAGSSAGLHLQIGPGTWGRWKARVLCGGKVLDDPILRIEATDSGRWWFQELEANRASATDPGGYLLAAGGYRVSIAGHEPVEITIKGGEILETTIELKFDEFAFSILPDLHSLLAKDGESVELLMSAPPIEDEVQFGTGCQPGWFSGVLDAAIAQMEVAAEEDRPYDRLVPDRLARWKIPRGIYAWKLSGTKNSVEGIVDLRGLTSLEFSLKNLPGRAAVTVDCAQLGQELPSVAQTALGSWEAWIKNVGESRPKEERWGARQRALTVLRDERARCLYVVSPPGRVALEIAWNAGHFEIVADVPGNLTLKPDSFMRHEYFGVEFYDIRELHHYREVIAVSDNLISTVLEPRDGKAEARLPAGWWTFYVSMQRYSPDGGVSMQRFSRDGGASHNPVEVATFKTLIRAEGTKVDLALLDYQEFGSLQVELCGRPETGFPRDPWWQLPTPCEIEAIDHAINGMVPRLWSRESVQRQPSLKPVRTSWAIRIPPGRYRVIPWPGATDSACKIVTVEPGKVAVIRFEGR